MPDYTVQERALEQLFMCFCPSNASIEHVLLKVTALNDFYSTGILDTYTVARHIVSMDVDRRLEAGDLTLVHDLAKVRQRDGRTRNNHSFATKYCSHHCPEVFPIFDRNVELLLWYFARQDGFAIFNRRDLKEYPLFVDVVKRFRGHYDLSGFTFREIDIYLWQAGKKAFPRAKKHTPTNGGRPSSGDVEVSQSRPQ